MTFDIKTELQLDINHYKVSAIRSLTEHTFVLSLPQSRFKFEAGQHISLSISGDFQCREYSIYSAEEGDNLEVLVKEVDGGYFSPRLKHLKVGDMVEVHGPFGKFGLDEKRKKSHKHVFIASGTGIAPFHSIVKSNPDLNYHLIHGVRYLEEGYGKDEYAPERLTLCTSRDKRGNYNGRLTEYLKTTSFDIDTCFYLCGNSDMIFDSMEILSKKGFGRDNITVEVYF